MNAGFVYAWAPAVQGDERAHALHLVRDITPEKITAWQAGSIIDWVNESHVVAVTAIYGRLPHDVRTLPASYEDAALPIVNEQLERNGRRILGLPDVLAAAGIGSAAPR